MFFFVGWFCFISVKVAERAQEFGASWLNDEWTREQLNRYVDGIYSYEQERGEHIDQR